MSMSKTTCHISISLDGFVAGPDQSLDNPLGVGGLRLHEWAFATDEWRARHGDEWDPDWRGWWSDDPPFHTPVIVLTHHPREPLTMDGGTTFEFVTDGVASALELARAAAGDRDVAVAGVG
jgi:hypothetical protein